MKSRVKQKGNSQKNQHENISMVNEMWKTMQDWEQRKVRNQEIMRHYLSKNKKYKVTIICISKENLKIKYWFFDIYIYIHTP